MSNLRVYIREVAEGRSRVGMLEGVFIKQIYYLLARNMPKDCTVIDIGAGQGDTPIYFAQFPHCRKVIGYECDKERFEASVERQAKSPFKDKIKMVNGYVTTQLLNRVIAKEKNIVVKCNLASREDVEAHVKIFTPPIDLKLVKAIEIVSFKPIPMIIDILKRDGFKVVKSAEGPQGPLFTYGFRAQG